MDDLKKVIEQIDEKLDIMTKELSEIRIVQAEQAKDLEHHIYRTTLNEHRIQVVEDRLIPLLEIKHKFDGAFKVVGYVCATLCTIGAFTVGAIKVAEFLFKVF